METVLSENESQSAKVDSDSLLCWLKDDLLKNLDTIFTKLVKDPGEEQVVTGPFGLLFSALCFSILDNFASIRYYDESLIDGEFRKTMKESGAGNLQVRFCFYVENCMEKKYKNKSKIMWQLLRSSLIHYCEPGGILNPNINIMFFFTEKSVHLQTVEILKDKKYIFNLCCEEFKKDLHQTYSEFIEPWVIKEFESGDGRKILNSRSLFKSFSDLNPLLKSQLNECLRDSKRYDDIYPDWLVKHYDKQLDALEAGNTLGCNDIVTSLAPSSSIDMTLLDFGPST